MAWCVYGSTNRALDLLLQELNEMSDVPVEIIKANNIPTLDSVFQGAPARH